MLEQRFLKKDLVIRDNMDDNIFNEKGEHKLEYLKKVIRTEVKIDFWEESVKIYVTIPQANERIENVENKLIGNVVNGRIRQKIIFNRFKVSEDFSTVTIDNYDWYIPVLFNRDSLKQQDIKTWEMVFYYIFKHEVSEALQKAKMSV